MKYLSRVLNTQTCTPGTLTYSGVCCFSIDKLSTSTFLPYGIKEAGDERRWPLSVFPTEEKKNRELIKVTES